MFSSTYCSVFFILKIVVRYIKQRATKGGFSWIILIDILLFCPLMRTLCTVFTYINIRKTQNRLLEYQTRTQWTERLPHALKTYLDLLVENYFWILKINYLTQWTVLEQLSDILFHYWHCMSNIQLYLKNFTIKVKVGYSLFFSRLLLGFKSQGWMETLIE